MEVAQMSSISTIRRDLRRQRQAAGNPLPIPLSRQDIELPDFYTMTDDGEQFLLYDSQDESRIVCLLFQRVIYVDVCVCGGGGGGGVSKHD